MMPSVGEILVQGLKSKGVDVVFGIPGVHTIELYRGLAGSGIRHVTARHEQGAAFMADGYARVSGRPGVAFVITGPGLTNALTAMAQAREDSVPILVISGVNRRASLGQGLGYLHELPDQGGMVRTLCPSFQVTAPEMLETVLTRAFTALTSGRPGPVHVEVPTDVMPLPCPPLSRAFLAQSSRLAADSAEIEAAARLLGQARRPVILAGGGSRNAAAAVRALAERLDAPVVQTTNARGLMFGHPLSVPACPGLRSVRDLIANADQILALGTEFGMTDYDMYGLGDMPEMPGMIRVDLCPEQLARQQSAVRIRADVAIAASAIFPLVAQNEADGAARAKRTMISARQEAEVLSPTLPVYLSMIEAIRDSMPNSIIVGDSTQPIYAGNLCHDHDRSGGWFNAATGFGALGFSTGAAVGAALAAPGAHVICLVGDGGLQFSPGELRTAVDEALPITFIVWNSASFGEIADSMVAAKVEVIGCTPSPLKLAPFAAACDLPFQSVGLDPRALKAALICRSEGPRLIEIRAF
jgi:acetolactate synthase-1/2/3 large subunit